MFGIRSALLLIALAGTVALVNAQNTPPIYRQPSAPVESRVADLLSRMTLAEKVAQLQGVWNRKREIQGADGRFDPAKAKALIGLGIGQVGRPSEIAGSANGRSAREQAVFVNGVQRWLVENTRLGIPAMFHEEALHGLTAPVYIRDQVSSVTRPVRELRGFERVSLTPGESKRVTFTLGPEELSLIDRRMQRVVEPGRFDVMVGTSLTPILTGTLEVVAR